MGDMLIGQCACGAALTVWHLQFWCPLLSQRAYEEEKLADVVREVFESRFDTTQVAVLGEN